MIKDYQWQQIFDLHNSGLSISEISRKTNLSNPTITKYLNNDGPKNKNNIFKTPKSLVGFEDNLVKLIKRGITNGRKLHRLLQKDGYQRSYGTLNRYLGFHFRDLIKSHKRITFGKSNETNRSFYKRSGKNDTGPGVQAQVDWGHFGKIEVNGRMENLSCFLYILGYSRALYIEFTIKQDLTTLLRCHINAFKALRIPKEIVYDNMKTVVINREKLKSKKQIVHFNPCFLEFADFYGFRVIPCTPRNPQAKGKVEAAVKFVRNDFMQGMKFRRDFLSLQDLNEKAKVWLDNEANVRIHRTTKIKPVELWQKEKEFLRFSGNSSDFETSTFVVRFSTKDGLIQYNSNYYSVPMEYSRRKLLVQDAVVDSIGTIKIYYGDKVITTHLLSHERGKLILDENHLAKKVPSKLKRSKKSKRDKFEDKSSFIFTRSLSYYDELAKKDSYEQTS